MQNFIQIPQKMKTGVQNVTKSVKDTLPFWPETNIKYFLSRTLDNCTPEEEALPTYMSGGRQAAMSHHYFPCRTTTFDSSGSLNTFHIFTQGYPSKLKCILWCVIFNIDIALKNKPFLRKMRI